MPWKESVAMDERLRFVHDALSDRFDNCSEDDKSPTLSHMTDEPSQRPAAWAPSHCS
jgi:hypothetical protein